MTIKPLIHVFVLASIWFDVKTVFKYRYLLWQLVLRNLSARYKGSYLGLIWSVAQPLLMLSVYTFVFTFVLRSRFGVPIEESHRGSFAMIMFCGLTIYTIFSESVSGCCTVISGHQNLVKKVVFPIELLPIAHVLSSAVFGMIWFILLLSGVLIIFGSIPFMALLLPLTIVPLILLSCGCGLIVSALGVYLRDLQYIVGVLLQILFFMTPIFYPVKAIPERFRMFLYCNPLMEIVEQTRIMILYGTIPNWTYLAILWIGALLVLHIGFLWFRFLRKGFSDVI